MSKHKITATIPYGDPDEGAEIECEIAFTFYPGSPAVLYGDFPHPEEPASAAFDGVTPFCNGKPAPFYGSFADLEQDWLDDLARGWLESDDGQSAAMETVTADDERGREYAAELRADR